MKKYLILIISLTGLLITILSLSCTREKRFYRVEGMVWNTMYHVIYEGPESLQDSIMPVLDEVGASLSVFDKNSLVSQLNEGDSVKTDRHLISVYEKSGKIHELSKGMFDPTLSPLIDAWGFGRGHEVTADTMAIDSLLKIVGFDKTAIKGDYLVKNDHRIQFNFSAIAKGYGCDAVGKMLARNGVQNYMVEIGGEISLKGNNPTGGEWKVAIDAPVDGSNPGESTALVIGLTDAGVATSGNYRNYRESGGIKTGHTISPLTGRPVQGKVLSATIVASDCMTADGIATACMASENPEELIYESKTEGLLIYPDSMWMSPGFRKMVLPQ